MAAGQLHGWAALNVSCPPCSQMGGLAAFHISLFIYLFIYAHGRKPHKRKSRLHTLS